ncbi:hypothetical protein E2C01_040563 [Portunus trituberculatus]|uniref:Uncharacterized protein n=1 Tax=Portunus trituberculatus TaxID=210409 RepID=A0A5B7FR45_PORTR|nr:hypothetical protein [Portunus trituberculatus]
MELATLKDRRERSDLITILKDRRERSDLITMYKLIHCMEKIDKTW